MASVSRGNFHRLYANAKHIPADMTEAEAMETAKGNVRENFIVGGVFVLIISGICFWIWSDELGLKNNYYILICTISTTIIVPLIFKFFIGDKPYLEKLREYKDWATCPNCGKSYCIDHTKQETISENITTKTKTDDKGNVTDTKRYRVGERKIYWHCKECNKMGDGIVEYEELIS